MQSHSRRLTCWFILAAISLAVVFAASAQQRKPAPRAARPQGKLAEDVYKNIKSLKGQPASELIPTMQFIANSLGVECSFCHDLKAFDKDTKEEKRTAREMIAMQQNINRVNFKGKREVTCNSCHRGQMHPDAIPALPAPDAPLPTPIAGHEEHHEHEATPAPASPTEYLDSFIEAAGGSAAFSKFTSRTERGTVNFGTAPASKFESSTRSTGQRSTAIEFPQGRAITTFDGRTGFTIFPGRHSRPLSAGEIDAMRIEADLEFPLNFKQRYSQFKVGHPENVNGKPANVLLATRPGLPPVRLYFDPATHMLTRCVYYVETPLGRNPTQVDIVRYLQAEGVQIPAQWIVTQPFSRTTYTVENSDTNPVPDAKFSPPVQPKETH